MTLQPKLTALDKIIKMWFILIVHIMNFKRKVYSIKSVDMNVKRGRKLN